jgi:D-3-phosphoglycerate dehydrogenase / 2-oxoglutarate reductase
MPVQNLHMPKIIALDTIAQEGLDLLKSAPGIEVETRTGLKGEALKKTLTEFDGAICRSGVKITADVLEGNRRLKAIVRAGVGTDNIDKNAATRIGCIVMNTPAGNTLSTAEHAFTLMLALSRKIAPAHASLISGKWDRNSFMGAQLADKTLGVVGMGRIGQEVAKRAIAFQMRVLAYDPFMSAEQASKLGVERVEKVHDMLPRIDYLTVHTPLTPETKHLISDKEIEMLRPGARLINCARGGIYDEAALVKGLESGRLGGVALDVFATEPCTDSPLYKLPNVLVTPHLGASTDEAQTQVAIEGAQLLINYFTTGEIRHAVNMASIDPKTLAAMKGYIDVAHRLGLLMSQYQGKTCDACKLTYRGEISKKNTRLLTSAFCAGLLTRALDEEVNIVSAEVLLQDRGIQLSEQSTTEMGAFSSSMGVEVVSEGKTYIAAATLFGHDMPRLIRLGDYRLEAYLDGNLLIFQHDDVPGVIGAVGTIFGKHKVNIAQMSVGRAIGQPGGKAIGVLSLDGPPPAAALEEILKAPHMQQVNFIEMPKAGELPPWLV